MSALTDLTGQRFGFWEVVKYAGALKWHCRCECGQHKNIRSSSLKNGASRSCGCIFRRSPESAIGTRFGAVLLQEKLADGRWLCVCDCGRLCKKRRQQLTSTKQLNCGSVVHGNRRAGGVPKTPSILPARALEIFKSHINKTARFKRFSGAEDLAIYTLIRCAYIIYWREEQGFPMASPEGYIISSLSFVKLRNYRQQKREKDGVERNNCIMLEQETKIGGEMTNVTFHYRGENVDRVILCVENVARHKKFIRC